MCSVNLSVVRFKAKYRVSTNVVIFSSDFNMVSRKKQNTKDKFQVNIIDFIRNGLLKF